MSSLKTSIWLLFWKLCFSLMMASAYLEGGDSDINVRWQFLGSFDVNVMFIRTGLLLYHFSLVRVCLLFTLGTFVLYICCTKWIAQCLFWFNVGHMLSPLFWDYNCRLLCHPLLWMWLISFHTQSAMTFIDKKLSFAAGAHNGFRCCPLWFLFYYVNILILSISKGESTVILLSFIYAALCLCRLFSYSSMVNSYVVEYSLTYYIGTFGFLNVFHLYSFFWMSSLDLCTILMSCTNLLAFIFIVVTMFLWCAR